MRMRMKRLAAILFLFGVSALNCWGADVFGFMGVGAHTCGQFAEGYRNAPQLTESLYFAWAQGFMSGQNMALLANHHLAKNLNAKTTEEQESFIRSHCDRHPLSGYWEAVMTLFVTLPDVRLPQNSN
jgi:hypothetical protein